MVKLTLQELPASKSEAVRQAADSTTPIEATLLVSAPNYVPDGVTLRARIDEFMFTCAATQATFTQLEQDPRVKSIGGMRALKLE